jgi:hypothetical protein
MAVGVGFREAKCTTLDVSLPWLPTSAALDRGSGVDPRLRLERFEIWREGSSANQKNTPRLQWNRGVLPDSLAS